MSSVKVINIWQCTPDAEDAFEQELKRLVDLTAPEEGCIAYQIYQPAGSRGEYVLIEEGSMK